MFLFAYGSLCDAATASAALGRTVRPDPARLVDWERGWIVAIDNHVSRSYACTSCGGLPMRCLVVGIRPRIGSSVLGALIAIGDDDLAVIRERERSYRLRHVRVRRTGGGVTALTAVPRDDLLRHPGDGAAVPAGYERVVVDALRSLVSPAPLDEDAAFAPTDAPRRDDLVYVRGDGVARRSCTCAPG